MDHSDKSHTIKILRELGFTQIQTDPFMVIDVTDNTYRFHDTITYAMKDMMQDVKIRHPDILAFKDGKPIIVEIDGAVHRNWDNDYDYDMCEINYIKINIDHLKKIDMDWRTWITLELQRLHV